MSRMEKICEDVNRGSALLNNNPMDNAALLNCSDLCCLDNACCAAMTRAQLVCEDVNYDRMANSGGGGAPRGTPGADDPHLLLGDSCALVQFDGSLFCVPASVFAASVRVPIQSPVWPNSPAVFPVGNTLSQLHQGDVSVVPRLPAVRHGVGGLRQWETVAGGAESVDSCWATAFADGPNPPPQSPTHPFVAECVASRGGLCGQQQQSAATIASGTIRVSALPLIRPPPESLATSASGCAFSEWAKCAASEGAEFVWCVAQGAPRPLASSDGASEGLPSSSSTSSPFSSSTSASSMSSSSTSSPSPFSTWSASPPPTTSASSPRLSRSSSSPNSSSPPSLSLPPVKASPSCSSPPLSWHLWIDAMVREVQAEIRAEQMLPLSNDRSPLLMARKRSFCSASPPTASPTHDSFSASSSSASSSSSNSSGSPRPFLCPFFSSSQNFPPMAKRAKKNSLLSLSHEALAERKKEQNRAAAQRYRSRKSHTLEQEREEIWLLERSNAQMLAEMAQIGDQIAQLRAHLSLGS